MSFTILYHLHLILILFRFKDVCTLFENLATGNYECSDCISGEKQDLETCICDQKEGECLINDDNFITWAHSESELDCFLVCSAMKDCKYYNWFSSDNEEIHQQCLLLSSCESVDSCTSGTINLGTIERLNNKSHGLSPPGGFSSLFFDQEVPYYSQRHLADRNAIYILHQ